MCIGQDRRVDRVNKLCVMWDRNVRFNLRPFGVCVMSCRAVPVSGRVELMHILLGGEVRFGKRRLGRDVLCGLRCGHLCIVNRPVRVHVVCGRDHRSVDGAHGLCELRRGYLPVSDRTVEMCQLLGRDLSTRVWVGLVRELPCWNLLDLRSSVIVDCLHELCGRIVLACWHDQLHELRGWKV